MEGAGEYVREPLASLCEILLDSPVKNVELDWKVENDARDSRSVSLLFLGRQHKTPLEKSGPHSAALVPRRAL